MSKINYLEKKIQQEKMQTEAFLAMDYTLLEIAQETPSPFWSLELSHRKKIKFMIIGTTNVDKSIPQINAKLFYGLVENLSHELEKNIKQIIFIINHDKQIIIQVKIVFNNVNASIYQKLSRNLRNIKSNELLKINEFTNLTKKEIDVIFALDPEEN